MNDDQWTMDNGQWTMGNGQWTMDNESVYIACLLIKKTAYAYGPIVHCPLIIVH